MMEWYHYAMIALGIAGFALQGLALLVGGTWKLSQMEARITASITRHRKEIDDAHTATVDALRREIGETVSALKAKVHEIETWARDHFVRRDSFEGVVRELKEAIAAQGDKIDKRLDRIDEKLDRR
jgi:hypothetical protein